MSRATTRQKQGIVLAGLERGMSRAGAAALASVGRATFYRWLDTPAFRQRCDDAEGRFEEWTIERMRAAAMHGSWAAVAWLAERRLPDRFRTKTELELSGSLGVESPYARIGHEMELLSDAELEARTRPDLFTRVRELVAGDDEELVAELAALGFERVRVPERETVHVHAR